MKKIVLIISVIFSVVATSFAQTGSQSVRGVVMDKQTLTFLPGAVISIRYEDKVNHTVSDTSGHFAIRVPLGRCDISVSYIGYDNYNNRNVFIQSGKETVLAILLEEKVSQLNEIVIKSIVEKDRPLNKMAVASARMLSTEEADRYAGSWNDPARMVSNLAGVASADDSRNDIVIRGNSPAGVQWRLDGFEIANPNHFGFIGGTGGNIGIINNNQLANSDFYTGAFPAEFGNLTSGLFDLKLKNGNSSKRQYLFSAGFNGLELGAEGGFSSKSNASYLINARYSFLQSLESLGFDISGTSGGVPKYRDITMKLNFPMKKMNLSLVLLTGASKISFRDDMTDEEEWTEKDLGQDFSMNNKKFFSGLSYIYRFNNNTRLESRLSAQMSSSAFDNYTLGYMNSSKELHSNADMKENRYSYSSKLISRLNSRNNFTSGIGADCYKNTLFTMRYPDGIPLIVMDSKNTSALFHAFFQWQHKFTDHISILPGVYSQVFSQTEECNIEPRLGFQWKLSPSLTFGAANGLYSQLQSPIIYFYKQNGKMVNKDVGMIRSWQSTLSLDKKNASSWRIKGEVYYQYLYNVPVVSGRPEESILNLGGEYNSDWEFVYTNDGKGYNYGIELTIEKFFDKNWYLMQTTSLYESKYRGYDGVLRDTRYNGNFALNLLAGYEFKLSTKSLMSLNLKIAFMGNERQTPAYSENSVDIVYDYSQGYSQRLPDYFRTDFNVNIKTNYRKFSLEYFIEIDNLTNRENVRWSFYNANKQKEVYYYQQSMMPMGGVRIHL